MKDPNKTGSLQVQLPAPTENLEKEWVMQDVDVPFYENFICSLTYNESTKSLGADTATISQNIFHR